MKKEEFLKEIDRSVGNLSNQEKASLMAYFEEMICDRMENGEEEEEIIASFGPLEEMIRILREEGVLEEKELGEGNAERQRMATETWGGERQQYSAVGEVHTIRIRAENRPVNVAVTDSSRAWVDFMPSRGTDEVETYEEGGEYVFHQHIKKTPLFGLFSLIKEWGRERRITLYVPETFCGRLIVEDANASVQVKGIGGISELHVHTSNSSIQCQDIQVSGTASLETGNSSITVCRLEGDALTVKTGNAKIRLDQIRVKGVVYAKTSNSIVEVRKVDASEIRLKTSNSKIRGSVVGDLAQYEISSRTVNASSNLPRNYKGSGERKLTAETSNGAIHITFE